MRAWVATHWVAAAAMMAPMLLLLAPLLARGHGLALIYLTLPAYMLHQVEEHWGDRFRTYVNTTVFGGIDALTTDDVLLINLPGVWGLNLLSLYAGAAAGPAWGLSALYLMLVNGLSHIAGALRTRTYNPGLATAVLVFLPLGAAGLWLIPASAAAHGVGLLVSLLVHGAIIARVAGRARTLRAAL